MGQAPAKVSMPFMSPEPEPEVMTTQASTEAIPERYVLDHTDFLSVDTTPKDLVSRDTSKTFVVARTVGLVVCRLEGLPMRLAMHMGCNGMFISRVGP